MINWQKKKLGEFISTIIDNRGRNPSSYKDVGVPVIDNFMIKDQKSIDLSETKRFIDNETFNTFIRRYIKPKDVLITLVGNGIGNVSQAPKEKSVIIQNTIGLRINDKIDNDFLFYYLKLNKGKILNLNRGAAQPSVKVSDLKFLSINLPLLPVQQKIAKILSNYDDLIENNLKCIKLLEESAKLTYEEWFLRFRIDGKKLDIDSATDLPFGWKKKPVTECDAFKQDKRKIKVFEGEKKYYATANITGTTITADGETVNWDNKPSRAQIKPNKNTVWFARMSDTYKVLCFNNKNINLQENSILSTGFVGFRARNDLCLPFLYFTINSNFFHELKDLYATGTTQVSLNDESMSYIKIIEPSADLVEEFGSRILPFVEEISVLRNKNQLLKEIQDILLPRLMTGMIDTDHMEIAV